MKSLIVSLVCVLFLATTADAQGLTFGVGVGGSRYSGYGAGATVQWQTGERYVYPDGRVIAYPFVAPQPIVIIRPPVVIVRPPVPIYYGPAPHHYHHPHHGGWTPNPWGYRGGRF